jgi:hypothetical protein
VWRKPWVECLAQVQRLTAVIAHLEARQVRNLWTWANNSQRSKASATSHTQVAGNEAQLKHPGTQNVLQRCSHLRMPACARRSLGRPSA